MADELSISQLEECDVEAAVALWEEVGLTRPWNDPRADIRRALEAPGSTVLAGRRGGELVATAMVGMDGHRGWVYYLAVAPHCRRQGYGAAMMRAGEQWAARQGAPKMQLMVRDDNMSVVRFYEAIGYLRSEVSVLARWLDDQQGEPDDAHGKNGA